MIIKEKWNGIAMTKPNTHRENTILPERHIEIYSFRN